MNDQSCVEYIERFRENGFVLIPDLVPPDDLGALVAVTDRLMDGARHTDSHTDVLELDTGHRREAPRIRRIKTPHSADPLFFDFARSAPLMQLVSAIVGPDIRLSHSKINTKAGDNGSPIEWHQDWAFAPHTNMDMCIVAVMLDDCLADNGPLMVMPGSHRGPLLEHHDGDGYFVGAIDIARDGVDLDQAVPLIGRAGSISIHHPMAIHGSAPNRSGRMRRMMFLEYAAADAFPLFYGVDWAEYMDRMVAGRGTSLVRSEPVFIKQPFPTRAPGSIFESQSQLRSRYFATADQS
ncbi:phytanoyl-CoA dioxygenase family protein [Neoroseomonas lacus]|uniref:Phytanoyl-CoA dioxygenase n=1 Tax=Neoroseomonas lacus TaxID=287609 RepID=A0A917NS66_9PROT|nr:phytanoyl-CoA dioxygenase family protein [Neoroseomonas lacus]GGJ23608.1 phytanoyl-CoA dioxygenase [Neoroseomonas lacus]